MRGEAYRPDRAALLWAGGLQAGDLVVDEAGGQRVQAMHGGAPHTSQGHHDLIKHCWPEADTSGQLCARPSGAATERRTRLRGRPDQRNPDLEQGELETTQTASKCSPERPRCRWPGAALCGKVTV